MSNVTQPSVTPKGGKHPVNILHLVMGVIFLGIVTVWALIEGQIASTDDLRWLIPLPWVIAGTAGLIVIMMSRSADSTPAAPAYAYAEEPLPAPDYTSDLEAKLAAEENNGTDKDPSSDTGTALDR